MMYSSMECGKMNIKAKIKALQVAMTTDISGALSCIAQI